MPTKDPQGFLSDPQVRIFKRTRRADLLAPDTPLFSDGRFIIYQNRTNDGQVEIVKYIAPFAQRRTNVGAPTESIESISPAEADTFFAYTPLVNTNPPLILDINMNAPRTAASPGNANRQIASGITHLSVTPWIDAQRYNPIFDFPVPAGQELIVTFQLLEDSPTAPIPNPFTIGAAAAKRVDFAGVVIYGVIMPQQTYNRLAEAQNNIYAASAKRAKGELQS